MSIFRMFRPAALFLTACLPLAFGLPVVIQAQQQAVTPINITTTAVPFLRISPDARSGGMGETGIATTTDAASIFYNMSKMTFSTEKAGLDITYTPWARGLTDGVYLLAASGYRKFGETKALSASLRYFNIGDLPIIDYNGNHLATASPREMAADLGYTLRVSDRMAIGLTARYIYSDITAGSQTGGGYHAGKAFAADVSFYYNGLNKEGQGWTFGSALCNLGSRISYSDAAQQKDLIPASLGAGGAYTAVLDEDDRLNFTGEVHKLLVPAVPADSAGITDYYNKSIASGWVSAFKVKGLQYNVGGEYAYRHLFFLRAGYFHEDNAQGGRSGFTSGLGLSWEAVGFDFSYLFPSGDATRRNPLSNTMRLGLRFNLSGK